MKIHTEGIHMLPETYYKAKLSDLFSDLHGIISKNTESYFASYKARLIGFLNDLLFRNKIFMQFKAQADRFLSSNFSFFDYMSIDENPMSDYIALILDKKGAHGQQNLFLDCFIDYMNDMNENGLKIPKVDYRVKREYWANGRIDIFLANNDTAMIIENKPYTKDQEDQLKRYFNEIKKSYENVFIIYLSKGDDPSEYSIPKDMLEEIKREGKFKTISLYKFSAEFLKRCYHQCESEKFRFFLSDFRKALESRFRDKEYKEETNAKH